MGDPNLLPCPFCGSEPLFESYSTDVGAGDFHRVFSIRCTDCAVGPKIISCGPSGYGRQEWRGEFESNEAARQWAAEEWNKREVGL